MHPHVLRVWVAEELRRSRNAWAPQRLPAAGKHHQGQEGHGLGAVGRDDGAGASGEDVDVTRVVETEDIRPAILPLQVSDVECCSQEGNVEAVAKRLQGAEVVHVTNF